jgi:hypothetical protein
VIDRERGSDDCIITTTNGTHVTPVIDRERGSDDWIITTTNGTHITPVIDRERGRDDWIITTTNGTHVTAFHDLSPLCSFRCSYNPVITSSFTTYHRYVPFVVVIIQSSLPLSRSTTNGTYS